MKEIALDKATASRNHSARKGEAQAQSASRPHLSTLLSSLKTPTMGVKAHASLLKRANGFQTFPATQTLLEMQRRYGNFHVQRVVAQAKDEKNQTELTPQLGSRIERARGAGQPLSVGIKSQMEAAFGADFGGVRIHTGSESQSLNRAVNAIAFTTGWDIFFREGAFNPDSPGGRELLAHELTHVVQQSGASFHSKFAVSTPGDQYEQEADRVAKAVGNTMTKATIRVDQASEFNRLGPVQRQCACGGHAALGGECEECKQERVDAVPRLFITAPIRDSTLRLQRQKASPQQANNSQPIDLGNVEDWPEYKKLKAEQAPIASQPIDLGNVEDWPEYKELKADCLDKANKKKDKCDDAALLGCATATLAGGLLGGGIFGLIGGAVTLEGGGVGAAPGMKYGALAGSTISGALCGWYMRRSCRAAFERDKAACDQKFGK